MATTPVALPPFLTFDVDEYSTISTRWVKYKRKFTNLCIALNITNDKKKLAMFLNYVGETVNDIYESLLTPEADETYDDALKLLDTHFKPKSKRSYEIYNFRQLKQEADEKIQQFYVKLRYQAAKCEFGANLERES